MNVFSSIFDNYLFKSARRGFYSAWADTLVKISMLYWAVLILFAIIGPVLAPYGAQEPVYDESGLLRGAPPSLEHPLGTTHVGYDVFSQLLIGVRPTVITGLLGGLIIISIGSFVGITAGYVGGRVEDVLMRITDFVYGVPLIPFAIVLLALFGFGFFASVVVIGLILWRASARVFRSQVLQIKERPYIKSAQATGASTPWIMVKHILPNIGPMIVLFFALGIGYSILLQASLSFVGVSDPFVPSWGIMLRNAYNSGQILGLWWYTIPPGILISSSVLTAFLIGRGYEDAADEGTAGARGEI